MDAGRKGAVWLCESDVERASLTRARCRACTAFTGMQQLFMSVLFETVDSKESRWIPRTDAALLITLFESFPAALSPNSSYHRRLAPETRNWYSGGDRHPLESPLSLWSSQCCAAAGFYHTTQQSPSPASSIPPPAHS